jgi:hypothetical protein
MFTRTWILTITFIWALAGPVQAASIPCPQPGENPPLGPWTFEAGMSTGGTVTYIVQGYADVQVKLKKNTPAQFELPDVASCGKSFASARAEVTFVMHPNNFPVRISAIDAITAAPKIRYTLVSTSELNVSAQIHYTIYIYSNLSADQVILDLLGSKTDGLVAKLTPQNVKALLEKLSPNDLQVLLDRVFSLPSDSAARTFILTAINDAQSHPCAQNIPLTPPQKDGLQTVSVKFRDYGCWFAWPPDLGLSFNVTAPGDHWTEDDKSRVVTESGFTVSITPHGGHGDSIAATSSMNFTATPLRPNPH